MLLVDTGVTGGSRGVEQSSCESVSVGRSDLGEAEEVQTKVPCEEHICWDD
jgi:hypothetical protein